MEKNYGKIGTAVCISCLFLFGMCVMYILCSDRTASDKALELVLYGIYTLLVIYGMVLSIRETVEYEVKTALKLKRDKEYLATLETANETYKQSIDELMEEIRNLRTQVKDKDCDY